MLGPFWTWIWQKCQFPARTTWPPCKVTTCPLLSLNLLPRGAGPLPGAWWTCSGSTSAWWERPSWTILVWSGPWESRWSSCKWWRNPATRPSRSWRWPRDSRQPRKRPWVARPWKRPGPFSWSAGCGASSRRGAEKDQRLDNFSPRTQPKSEKIKKEAGQTIALDCFLFLSF